ncbi:MAG: Glycosyltransferase involved in cell wall biogenesis [Candidatus Nomurabacteria bacterium GW2011_GWF2_35_66]|uniref:Glycosyltransferase involved in cell wall biogenesis n=1 Tax=Candidatus Nomurabacteria bacterium GW2011_GWE1_35_16 TaxID=1618761 RepID=A0A0G0EG66_9BACT|nr:MAG: Glycosyltransferase involved in cell wall biogenesis [Candidatus Nomurabacteria bacterium GW2011_GWF1_34_20]KKP63136.1 MAG: Glycosyltransferase involved in cell wall biogenesis [Candidatus Nomurabacteria bacterium GW2011_GWE2_34_25]KKP66337.1 MAG: Glycosyltransferase involved in cell wall biogenesis [Candidatus Nomurabacteria bacterium GW2011_GWE1_35_16]KKP83222.1 MAG: Glycosyltransferase involved in cell wall biogenesis [Candidatus Nomurabacteria bacterium GW2011_GWF2_35_66]HAE36327.1 
MLITDILLYTTIFASVYVQVLFLLSFFEKKELLQKYNLNNIINENELPPVTFLVPCWNEEKTISKTINSIKNLTYPANKIFIHMIDDGSKDNTWKELSKFSNDPQISIFKKENGGKFSALNYSLPEVKTEFVASFDADTTINEDALLKIISYFTKDKDISAVGGSILIKSPKTMAQKAQSVEYQMFSFSKKVLALLGGPLVVPGAFSVFKIDTLRKVGGWKDGHGLEDLELTYRMQVNGYKVEHSHDSIAFTTGPKTIRNLFTQRLRWGYGFLKNTKDYKSAIFNKKFGNFGIFTLPMSLMSYFIIVIVFGISWYNIFLFLYDKFLVLKLLGVRALFGHISFNLFYFNTKAIVFLSILTIIFFAITIIFGRKISNVREKNFGHIFYFFILYSLIVPFWVIKNIWNALISNRPAWR